MEPGTQFGNYEILSVIGTGGVWRARDTKLGREVAIRTLPEYAEDAQGFARLERDARILGALDHPNIAGLHGLEESGGRRFLVMELVEGETLAERVRRGAIPARESLQLALQIAEALESAHENGIVHRDLGPRGIKITPEGRVKVLDFGLAGVLPDGEAAGNALDISNSPTMAVTATRSGTLPGTAAYMPPEQARGEAAGTGADIWAFGCVLFEMLTGTAPFAGKTDSDTLAAVLKAEPDWGRLPAGLHPRVRFLLERCLEKRAASRASDMAGIRADIEKTLADPVDTGTAARAAGRESIVPWTGAAVLSVVLAAVAGWSLSSDTPLPVVRFRMQAYPPGGPPSILQALSPELRISRDGSRVVFRGVDGALYLRDLGDTTPRPVQITDAGEYLKTEPVFSPDGSELVYVDAPAVIATGLYVPSELLGQTPPGDLKRVPVGGGTPTPVLTGWAAGIEDVSWGTDDTILFVDSGGNIQTIPANGGTPTALFQESGARYPQLLPGGAWALYSDGQNIVSAAVAGGATGSSQIVVRSLADPEDRRVVWEGGTQARYVEETGHIVYVGTRQPGLWAFAFDLERLEKTGDPVPMVEGPIMDYDISDTGSLTYALAMNLPDLAAGDAGTAGDVLALTNRNGAIVRRLRLDPGQYRNPRFSPDGNRIAYEFMDASGESHIWIYDLSGDFPQKLTSAGENIYPVWRDAESVTYASDRNGAWGVYTERLDGSGEAELLVSAPEGTTYRPQAWSPEGVLVLVAAEGDDPRSGRLAMLSADSQVAEIAPAEPGSDEYGAVLSPDGTFLVYMAACDTPPGCVRVRRFPPVPGSSVEVIDSEAWVFLSPDGAELFSSPTAGALDVRDAISEGGTVDFRNARRIVLEGAFVRLDNRSLDIRGPDGQQLVLVVPAGDTAGAPTGGRGQGPLGAVAGISARIDYFHNFFDVLAERVQASGDR